ncbi:MAG: hypothetical protein LBU88_01735 [Treponema sp.]|jgi:hypothetical protein|nr:hypothetical protein [Treponema sp.]
MGLRKPFLLFIILPVFLGFTTCGIDEYFYLPQISQGTESATGVKIMLPSISSNFYYASSYVIFYKIYLSNAIHETTINISLFNDISTHLVNDWNNLRRFVDSTTTSIPARSDFFDRGYYELQFQTSNLLRVTPGTTPSRNMEIIFNPAEPAEILMDNVSQGNILRNDSFEHSPNADFLSSDELRSNENAGKGNVYNHDVAALESTGTALYAYVSMFILTSGTNPTSFNPIFSKPTHLGVFLLRS